MTKFWTYNVEIEAETPEEAAALMSENLLSWGGQKLFEHGYLTFEEEPDEETPDDDPYCVCGVARSEHALCGCGEWQRVGTYTPTSEWYPYEEWEDNR